MKKRILFLFAIIIFSLHSYGQTTVLRQAKSHLKEMNDVVEFTEEQKSEIILLFKDYVTEQDALQNKTFTSDKEKWEAIAQKYLEIKKQIYALCTEEQMDAYRTYKLKKQDDFFKANGVSTLNKKR